MKKSSDRSIGEHLHEFTRYSELKQMAYNIAALQQEKKFYSLTVLSFYPGEGKTLTCAAIASAYAETCRTNVLVVDTTTFQTKGSLVLGQCLGASHPRVQSISLDDLRNGSTHTGPSLLNDLPPAKGPALEPEDVPNRSLHLSSEKEDDFSLIKRVTSDRSNKFGLVLLDTAPLSAKNKSNVNPLLLARMSDASVLVVSRKLLKSPELDAHLKAIEDPALHLIGMISNEEHDR